MFFLLDFDVMVSLTDRAIERTPICQSHHKVKRKSNKREQLKAASVGPSINAYMSSHCQEIK